MKRNWKEINQKGRLVCRKCGIEKSLCEFRKRGKSKIPDIQYHSLECKECQSERLIPIKSDGSIIICKNSHRYIKENGKWNYLPYAKPYYMDDDKRIQKDIELIKSLYGDEFKTIMRYRKPVFGYFVSKKGEIISTRGKKPKKMVSVANKPVGVSNSNRKILGMSFKVGLPKDFHEEYTYKSTISGGKYSSCRIATHRAVMETWKPIDNYPPDSLKEDWDKAPESFKQWVRDTAFIDHINDDPTDNSLDNLRWSTPLENQYARKMQLSL